MSRNIVILFDGTNNEFREENTNIVRLAQVLERDSPEQLVYYDPGVGTLPEPGAFTSIAKTLSKWYGLAFGSGLTGKVEQAYSYLMDYWQPGARLFLFGFSRGAYTARVLAGMLHTLGLLAPGNHNLVPYAMRLFKSVRSGTVSTARQQRRYWNLCAEFRRTFARPITDNDRTREFPTHFIGVWDTVSSVGWVYDPARFPYTAKNPSVATARQAVSIDERRWFFRQNLFEKADGQDCQQQWFPGVHSDVGGGYPREAGHLWWPSFKWMLDEARKFHLLINDRRSKKFAPKPTDKPWTHEQHESLQGAWWLGEIVPKWQWQRQTAVHRLRCGLGRRRTIHKGALIHESALRRIQDVDHYRPPNMSMSFIEKVRQLQAVPPFLPYDPNKS